MTSAGLRVGQRVRVPWGLEVVEGTIVDVLGSGDQCYVRVAVELGDPAVADETPIVALPADVVEATTAA